MRDLVYGAKDEVVAEATSAWGLRFLREGFSFDPTHDRLFALGYPHLRLLATGTKEDAAPAEAALALLGRYEPYFRLVWPAETARRWVRLMGGPYVQSGGKPTKKAREKRIAETASPVDLGEATTILQFVVRKLGKMRQSYKIEELVLLVEAMVGPKAVAEIIVHELEQAKPEAWREQIGARAFPQDLAEVIYALGFVMLRVQSDEADALRNRLTDLHSARTADAPDAFPTRMLDGVLAGAAGLERSALRLAGGERNPRLYAHGGGDATVVRLAATEHQGPFKYMVPDARLVFLGGDEVLDAYARYWSSLKSDAQSFFLATVGEVRAETTVDIVAAMLGKSKVKRQAKAWFKAHQDFARSRLEVLASKGDGNARAALKLL